MLHRRLFEEMHVAFKTGRSQANPALNWYKGELWFFGELEPSVVVNQFCRPFITQRQSARYVAFLLT